MKLTLYTLLLSSLLASADNTYLNWIRVEHADGVAYDINDGDGIDESGTRVDSRGVIGSVRYRLYTIHRTDSTIYFLDEKTVSSYHPQATLEIVSQDPYEAIPRTRVDKPFSINYTTSGIVTDDPDVQDAAKSVVFDHRMTAYAPGSTEAATDAAYDVHDHDLVTVNGNHSINNVMTQIPATNLTTLRGEEIFSIYANPDWGVTAEASLLAQQRIQVWPIARGTLSGIDTTVKYTKIPDISVNLLDLYPDSTTYIRFYKGNPSASPAAPIKINTSYCTIDDVIPIDRSYVISSIDDQVVEDGIYTVEIIHETPFGADLLAQIHPLQVERGITINGNVNSSE